MAKLEGKLDAKVDEAEESLGNLGKAWLSLAKLGEVGESWAKLGKVGQS